MLKAALITWIVLYSATLIGYRVSYVRRREAMEDEQMR